MDTTDRPDIIVNGQTISGSDPNYDAYAAQLKLDAGETLTSSQIPLGGYVPGGNRSALPTTSSIPLFNQNVYQPPTPQSPLTADALAGGTNPLKVPFPNINTNLADSTVAGAKTYQDYIKSLETPQTETEKKQQSILDMMAGLTGDLSGKGAEQLAQEQSAGLPRLRQQFADINGQIATKLAEYNVLSTANQNKPITMDSIIGNERAIQNAKAADIGLLQARALALQGQIQVAQDTVNRAIDLKYSTIEAQLNVYQAQLNAIQPELNKEEKIRAQAQQMMIDDRNQAIADQKAEQKNIQNLMLDAASKGASNDVLSQISSATTLDNAAKIYSTLVGRQQNIDVINQMTSKGYTYLTGPSQLAGLSESQITRIKDANGTDLIFKNPVNSVVDAYVKQIQAGTLKLLNVPADVRDEVAKALNNLSPSPSPSPSPTPDTPEEKQFQKDLNAEITKLQRGGKWGASWNFLMNKYGSQGLTNEQLDAMLNKDKYYNN